MKTKAISLAMAVLMMCAMTTAYQPWVGGILCLHGSNSTSSPFPFSP